MTLRPALARFERGFRRMGSWTLARVTGARPYRYEGEQEAHAEQLRGTQISLSLMANATEDPDQVRMASDIEHDAEARLTVLLGRARLSREEKWERDAIQRAIEQRRQGFAGAPRRFLPALPAVAGFALRPWMLWAGALILSLTWGLYSDIRAGRAELQRDEAESLARANFERAEQWQARSEEYRQALVDAANVARFAADALEAERAAQARAAARERRRNRELQNVLTDSPEPPAWRLRDDGTEDRSGDAPTG